MNLLYYQDIPFGIIPPRHSFTERAKTSLLVVTAGCATFLAFYFLVQLAALLFPDTIQVYTNTWENAGFKRIGLIWLYVLLLAPFLEEILFRLLLLKYIFHPLPFFAANILQAFAFGLYHMNLVQGIYTFFIGLLIGYVFRKTGHLGYAFLFHFTVNAMNIPVLLIVG